MAASSQMSRKFPNSPQSVTLSLLSTIKSTNNSFHSRLLVPRITRIDPPSSCTTVCVFRLSSPGPHLLSQAAIVLYNRLDIYGLGDVLYRKVLRHDMLNNSTTWRRKVNSSLRRPSPLSHVHRAASPFAQRFSLCFPSANLPFMVGG